MYLLISCIDYLAETTRISLRRVQGIMYVTSKYITSNIKKLVERILFHVCTRWCSFSLISALDY